MRKKQGRKPSDAALVDAFQKNGGIVTHVAEALGCSTRAVFKWVAKDPALREELELAREVIVDVAESELYKMVRLGKETAVFYVLNNHPAARRRGWGQKAVVPAGTVAEVRIIEQDETSGNSDSKAA